VKRLLLALAIVAAAGPAFADGPDPAAAADLFREGRAALADKDYERACAKFAESQRLDARVGTLINLAVCEEALNRLASARQHWEQATDLGRATSDARAEYTMERFTAIDKRVPRLLVRLAASAPPESVVRRDGVELGAASLGTPLPVDPGAHTVIGAAPGHEDGAPLLVELKESESREIEVAPGPALPEPPRSAPARAPAAPERARPFGALRTAAIAAGATGVVGLGLGTYFGIKAIDGKSGAPGVCHGDVCDAVGSGVRKDALRAGNAATASFIVGGGLLAAGIVMWFLAPARRAGSLSLAPSVYRAPAALGRGEERAASLVLEGSFR
jgi:hypothetical protein